MKIFEGKTPSERKKLIAAMVLGALAVLTLVYNFSGTFFGGRKVTVSVTVTPTPTATLSPGGGSSTTPQSDIQLLSQDQIVRDWLTTPVLYAPGSFYAPDAGRNIFAFYEPPEPTPYLATPEPIKSPPTPVPQTPAPPPPILLSYVSPQSVYAGSKGFRLEASGDKFTPDSVIIWNGSQLPTTFVSPQKLSADIPANMIAGEGQRSIDVRTPTGKYSNPVMLTVQAPPRPTVQYIGVEMARRGNNNTAYFREPGNPVEFGRRLSDIVNPSSVNNRFRVVSISVNEVILEDTSLGFRHKVPMARPTAGGGGGGVQTAPSRGGFERTNPGGRFPTENTTVQPYNPTMPQTQEIPGIPSNIPRYVPPTPQQQKKDEDDDEDGDN